MNRIRQHIPAFMDIGEPRTETFETKDDLLSLQWVEAWSDLPQFHRYSLADVNDQPTLMAEVNDGFGWWVIGFLEKPIEGFPEWKPRYKDKADEDRRTNNRS